MEEDILKYSPTVMFRGTPCIIQKIGLKPTFACHDYEMLSNIVRGIECLIKFIKPYFSLNVAAINSPDFSVFIDEFPKNVKIKKQMFYLSIYFCNLMS